MPTITDAAPHVGARFEPPRPDALRSLFPQLEILGLLGRGGMGEVYQARQRGLDRMVALKILPPQIPSVAGFAERFAREARAMASLNHPNIVTVFDLGQSGPLYYFLMEYVDGMNLRQRMQSHRLTAREALGLMVQICDALEFAHEEGIVHRDIKPENILLDGKGRVKIADFGLAKLLAPGPGDVRLTQSGQVMGTMHYMAPEQFDSPLAVDHRADIYSLGVVLYEMLTGQLPLGRYDPPSRMAAVDPRLDELVLRTLERRPAQRFQQVRELRVQLESIAGIASRISPEASRKLSYEYRSKARLFGWPLLHVATGVDPVTGRKRHAKGILAVGTAPRGLIAFGDVAVGVVACGIVGYGVVSVSIVAVGGVALGSVAAGLWLALGGMAVAPVALGGAAFGYYASGALAWGRHAISPHTADPVAVDFFDPLAATLVDGLFQVILVATPLFLALGFLPSLMARISERRTRRRLQRDPDTGEKQTG